MIGQAIAFVLQNGFIALFAIAVVTTIVKLRRFRMQHRPVSSAYFPQVAAPSIGWSPSPFEYELGWIEIALGLVALMALWRGYEFRLAASIVFAIFALAAAAGHIQQMQCCHNYAPGNAGLTLWFGDIFVPGVIVVLAALCRGERA